MLKFLHAKVHIKQLSFRDVDIDGAQWVVCRTEICSSCVKLAGGVGMDFYHNCDRLCLHHNNYLVMLDTVVVMPDVVSYLIRGTNITMYCTD